LKETYLCGTLFGDTVEGVLQAVVGELSNVLGAVLVRIVECCICAEFLDVLEVAR